MFPYWTQIAAAGIGTAHIEVRGSVVDVVVKTCAVDADPGTVAQTVAGDCFEICDLMEGLGSVTLEQRSVETCPLFDDERWKQVKE